MPEEWFDVAYINFNKAILHGRITAGIDEHRVRIEAQIEQVLTDEQREAIADLGSKHDREIQRLLGSFVDRAALAANREG